MASSKTGKAFVPTVKELSDGALHCHVYGHRWDEGPVTHGVAENLGVAVWIMRLHCTSCGKDRVDYLEPETFELLWRTYSDTIGYRVAEPAVRTDFRGETIARNVSRQSSAKKRRAAGGGNVIEPNFSAGSE
jgi:hypothetical protein